MYETNIEKNGQIIHRSKNLRGMLDYSRISPVLRAELTPVGKVNGRLRVIYADGASSSAHFDSYRIAVDFVRNRVRNRISWTNAEIFYYGGDMGYLTKPGVIAGV